MTRGRRWMPIVGARPQFVKAAVLCRAIDARNASGSTSGAAHVAYDLIHTGQHHDRGMSQVFFEEMEIPAPAANLGIAGGPHGAMTGRMLAALEAQMIERKPDRVIVFGDTNSTLAGALAAVKLGIPLAHVEAGLRSFNRAMPEEINRVLTDAVADLLFCPSEPSRENLAREGVTRGVHVTGDVMFDAVRHYAARAIAPRRAGVFALATIHRRENTDDRERLAGLLEGLARSPVPVVLPLHPRTKQRLEEFGLSLPSPVEPVAPLGYFELLGHLRACRFVLTDSGGLQKEACYLHRRCITLRDETEWTELIRAGVNELAGADPERISAAIGRAMDAAETGGEFPEPYGAGDAGERIVRLLAEERA